MHRIFRQYLQICVTMRCYWHIVQLKKLWTASMIYLCTHRRVKRIADKDEVGDMRQHSSSLYFQVVCRCFHSRGFAPLRLLQMNSHIQQKSKRSRHCRTVWVLCPTKLTMISIALPACEIDSQEFLFDIMRTFSRTKAKIGSIGNLVVSVLMERGK